MVLKQQDRILAEKIAEKLKAVRKEKGFTQENVIFDLGLNIGRIEIAENIVTIPVLKRLCDYYGISLEEFFKGF